MIAKIALLFAAFAAAQANMMMGSRIIAPGLLSPLAMSSKQVVVIPGAVSTDSRTHGSAVTTSQVAIKGAVTSDKRIIGTTGIIAGAPILNNGLIGHGLIGNGLIGNGLIGNGLIGNGLIGNGLIGNGLIGNGLVGNGMMLNGVVGNGMLVNGMIGNGLINKGLVAPLPLLAGPGLMKTLL